MLQDIVSLIGAYIWTMIFLVAAHASASSIDGWLYTTNMYNSDRKTIKVGLRWLFWRCKKDDKNEIFVMAFVHELISVTLFVVVTILFVVVLLFKQGPIVLLVSSLPIIIYLLYCRIIEDRIAKKKN